MAVFDEHSVRMLADAMRESKIAPVMWEGKGYGLMVIHKSVTDERVVRRLLNDGVMKRVPRELMMKLKDTVVCAKKGTMVFMVEISPPSPQKGEILERDK